MAVVHVETRKRVLDFVTQTALCRAAVKEWVTSEQALCSLPGKSLV